MRFTFITFYPNIIRQGNYFEKLRYNELLYGYPSKFDIKL